MRHIDFTPLYRSTVGFDHFVDMFDSMTQSYSKDEDYESTETFFYEIQHKNILFLGNSMLPSGFVLSSTCDNHVEQYTTT